MAGWEKLTCVGIDIVAHSNFKSFGQSRDCSQMINKNASSRIRSARLYSGLVRSGQVRSGSRKLWTFSTFSGHFDFDCFPKIYIAKLSYS